MKRYVVALSDEERAALRAFTQKGKASARVIRRAHLLLLADAGKTDEQIHEALQIGIATVERLRKRCVEEGVEAALHERYRPGGTPKLGPKQEAFLMALACSDPPEGRACWTMQLLADEMVALGQVESLSDETVRRLLKKGRSSRGKSVPGASPR
jgi:transposase